MKKLSLFTLNGYDVITGHGRLKKVKVIAILEKKKLLMVMIEKVIVLVMPRLTKQMTPKTMIKR